MLAVGVEEANRCEECGGESQSWQELVEETHQVRLSAVRISNISWDLTSSDVVEFLCDGNLLKTHIHIPIDRTTGKTKGDAYVEMLTLVEAIRCVARGNKKLLKGRIVTVTLSSLEELYAAHFADPNVLFISQAEAASLIAICRNYKAHFSRKCAERPFEHVISIMKLAPWHLIDEIMSECLYALCVGSIEALLDHLERLGGTTPPSASPLHSSFSSADCLPHSPPAHSSQLGPELLQRMVGAAITFPAFSMQQRMTIEQLVQRPAIVPQSTTIRVPLARPARHLRRSSIERILEELAADRQRSTAVDKMLREAFDQIMLSSGSPPKLD